MADAMLPGPDEAWSQSQVLISKLRTFTMVDIVRGTDAVDMSFLT